MNYLAGIGRGIMESILFAASGGEFTQKRLKNRQIIETARFKTKVLRLS
jgi:hypothetical protein